jgi:HD-GYP domain-containing protein (c-di-GMP phosphodiesterase class II)
MTDTKELLQKITALRKRLDTGITVPASTSPVLASTETLQQFEEQVQRGALHNTLMESAIRCAELSDPSLPTVPEVRLTARGVRLIRKGRELLSGLRTIADEPAFRQLEENDYLLTLHREGVAMIEVLLRTVQMFPPSVSAQLRMCDGLEVILRDAEERIALLCSTLVHRKGEIGRINELAEFMRALATQQEVRLAPLQAMADFIIEEAKALMPLRFLYASPAEPARFAAAHGLNVAHVMARILLHDAEWDNQLQLAIMATLLHDVGMVRIPAELLLTQTPLDTDQRRLIEKHTVAANEMLSQLWPGGGWPVEAAVHHHERADGSGYPSGHKMLEQSQFVRLLQVCDMYTAMCSPRPHRPAQDTRTVLTEILFLSERDFLDKKAAERLLALSFYPVGSAVELNDGAIAIVQKTHTHERGLANPARPVVQLVADGQGQATTWPIIVDLLEQTDHSIVRSLTPDERITWLGKKYPQLV